MLHNIVEINSISAIRQNIRKNIYGISEIQYELNPVGKGGVGMVHRVINLDGKKEEGLLVKLISDTEFIEKAYETISLLHEKLNRYSSKTNTPIFNEFPELFGLPILAFKAKLGDYGENIAGFLMLDLHFFDFNDFGAENWNKNNYISNVGFEEKLFLGYQLACGITFLHDQKFIHSDLKDYSIFINIKTPQLSIIDFDGGYHYDSQDAAMTIGAITSWASAKWRSIIGQGKSAKDVSAKERLEEENWILASGLFEIIFGIPPYYFLINVDEVTIDTYLKNNRWPYFKDNSNEINPQNIKFHSELLKLIEHLGQKGLKPLIDAFIKIFNEGHKKENERLSSHQWKDLLFEINKKLVGPPKIVSFKSDKQIINIKNENVEFQWDANFYKSIFIDGKLQEPLTNVAVLNIEDTKDVKIRVINDFGETTEKININSNKVNPIIHNFSSNIFKRKDLTPVILNWQVSHCNKVSIKGIGDEYPANGEVTVNPLLKTIFYLTAFGFFDQTVSEEIEIDVESVKILSFRYEINIEKGIDNIDLFWETESANTVEIQPRIGLVDTKGKSHIGINDKTEFTLIAEGFFNRIQKTIETQPFPIPIIKGIFVPTPVVQLEIVIPEILLNIPNSLSDSLKVNFNNTINFNNIEPHFVDLIDNKIEKESNGKSDKMPIDVRNLFENLFKKVNKK